MKKILLLIFLLTISLGQSQTPAAGPSTPPTRNPWDVKSQYGAAYTNIPDIIFDNFGGGATIVGDVTLDDSSVVKKYTGHSYSGISANSNVTGLFASEMTHLHLDVWSPDFVSFKIKLEAMNGTQLELEVPFPKVQNSWNSYDINLSTYTGVDFSNLKWIVPVTFGPNNTTLFITNVYFYRPATTQPPTLGTFTVAPQTVGAPNYVITPPTSNSAGAFSYTSSNTNVAQIVNGNEIQIIGAGTSTIVATQAADGPYGSGTASATFSVSPSASPIPPARDPSYVFSMFTGTPPVYANGVTAIRAPWTAATTLNAISNGTDTCLQLDNFGYLGYITNAANFSVAGKTKLHVDIYLNTPLANMFIVLLAPNDFLYNTGPLVAGWNSIDINLTSFPGANLTNINGIKFEKNIGAPATIYLDNIYFYLEANQPLLSNFSIPTQAVGAPNFTITPPTSNSAGAFSYTSSNTNVAQIVNGNQIQIINGGSAIITANQAADGPFVAGTITTTFVATFPAPGPSPIPPARPAANVVSMFTGTPPVYANPVGYSMVRSPWTGATTLTTISNGADTCLQVDNLGFLGYVTSTEPVRFSVVGMTKLHVDIYLNAPMSNLFIFLLTSGDQLYNTGPLAAGWNSLDINLSSFVGANLANVYGFKFEQNVGPPIQMYLDNIYFYVSNTEPTLTNFSIPTQPAGAPDFTITPPTSNSPGAFSYFSSNTNVAQIVNGNQIQIIGGGSSIITATQAAAGGFDAASISTTFVVSFGPPPASPVPPARAAADVFSLFTGSPSVYANPVGFNMVRSDWTAATTLTTIPNGTNTCLKVDNLGFLGYVTSTEPVRFSVASMTRFHVDIYVNQPISNLMIFLLTNGDQLYNTGPLTAGWNSVDISLSSFTGANLANVYGFKFEQNVGPAVQMYLDNIYFWRPPSTTTVNLKLFIEGYYAGSGAMRPVKNNQDGVSPATDVETITVELHDATAPYATVAATTAVLKTDGTAVCTFPAISGSYYLAVKNNNTIQTWSSNPETVGASALTYDFTTAANKAYGDNMLEIESGIFVFYSGDMNQDEAIDNTDGVDLTNDIDNSEFGIKITDLNGDGSVDNSDAPFFDNNAVNSIFSNHP